MKRVNYLYSSGTLTKGTADNLFENEHNAAEIAVVFESGISFEDGCSFIFQFHTPDCRRPRCIADYDPLTKTVSAPLAGEILCAGRVSFDLEMITTDSFGDIISVTQLISSDFTVKPAICGGEEISGEYTDSLKLLEQKYIKSKDELNNLIRTILNSILPAAMTRIDDAVQYAHDQTDLTIQMTEEACAAIRTELANDIRRIIEDNLADIDRLTVSLGSVEFIGADEQASVYNSGTAQDMILNFRLPQASVTINGKNSSNGEITLTYQDIPNPAYRICQTDINCELPIGAVTGERGGYAITVNGDDGFDTEVAAACTAVLSLKKNGEIRDRIDLPPLHKWDRAVICRPGAENICDESQGITIYRETIVCDVTKRGGWMIRRAGDNTELYTNQIHFTDFNPEKDIPEVWSPAIPVSAPGRRAPDDGKWLISVNENGFLSFLYGGEYNGTISGFRTDISAICPYIAYRSKERMTSEYYSAKTLDIRPGDEIRLMCRHDPTNASGSILFGELSASEPDGGLDADAEKCILKASGVISADIPQSLISQYICSDVKRDIICRGQNILPPLCLRDGIFETPELIQIIPHKKYYLRFFGEEENDTDITLRLYDENRLLISETACRDAYFVSPPNASFAEISVDAASLSHPENLTGMVSSRIINRYLPYRIRHMNPFADGSRTRYRVKLFKGGEILAADNQPFNAEVYCSPQRTAHTLSEQCSSGDFVPYGVCENPVCKINASCPENAEEELSGSFYFFLGGNQYDPYISSSPVSDYENRSFVEKRQDGIIRAYNTDTDKLVIRDNEPTVLRKNTYYTLTVFYKNKIGNISPDISATDGKGNQLTRIKMGGVQNGYRYTVITQDSNEVYFTFIFNPGEGAVKSIDYRVAVNPGEHEFKYTPYESPYILPTGILSAGEAFKKTAVIPLTRGGLVYFKPISGTAEKAEAYIENEFKLIACDTMEEAVSIYSRKKDSEGNTLHGTHRLKINGCRSSSTSKSMELYSKSGLLSVSADVSYLGLSTSTQPGDIITVYGR